MDILANCRCFHLRRRLAALCIKGGDGTPNSWSAFQKKGADSAGVFLYSRAQRPRSPLNRSGVGLYGRMHTGISPRASIIDVLALT